MLDKYFFACLIFTFSKSTVSEISLDYYFGLDDSLRSAKYIDDCYVDGAQESCQQRCGPNHACLLGKCFCVHMKPQIKSDKVANTARFDNKLEKLFSKLRVLDDTHKNVEDQSPGSLEEVHSEESIPLHGFLLQVRTNDKVRSEISSASQSTESESEEDQMMRKHAVIKEDSRKPLTRESDSHSAEEFDKIEGNLLNEYLRKMSINSEDRRESSSRRDSSEESIESNPEIKRLAELALRPTLRHHIAHFCPNLDIARQCIRKCMERGKPAFCGKDHVCYCGHKYGTPNDDIMTTTEDYSQFEDLYKKYFGPKFESQNHTLYTATSSTPRAKLSLMVGHIVNNKASLTNHSKHIPEKPDSNSIDDKTAIIDATTTDSEVSVENIATKDVSNEDFSANSETTESTSTDSETTTEITPSGDVSAETTADSEVSVESGATKDASNEDTSANSEITESTATKDESNEDTSTNSETTESPATNSETNESPTNSETSS